MAASRFVCTLPALLMALACCALPVRADGAPTVQSSQRADAVEIRASAHLAADRETAWRVLTDYGRYPEFIPDLRVSRVVSRSGTTVVVEQEGDATVGPFLVPLAITFQVHEAPPREIESRAIAGSLHSLESHYALADEAGGTRLSYSGLVRMRVPFFGWFGRSAVEANVRRQFIALVGEIDRQRPVDRGLR